MDDSSPSSPLVGKPHPAACYAGMVPLRDPLPVHYHEPGDPNKTSDPRLTISPERGARELAAWRQGQEEIQRAIKDTELASEIDQLRGAEAAQPQASGALVRRRSFSLRTEGSERRPGPGRRST